MSKIKQSNKPVAGDIKFDVFDFASRRFVDTADIQQVNNALTLIEAQMKTIDEDIITAEQRTTMIANYQYFKTHEALHSLQKVTSAVN